MYCPNCQAPYTPGANFCFHCGRNFTYAVPPSFQPAAATVPKDKSLVFLGIFVCWRVCCSLCWLLMSKFLFLDYKGNLGHLIRYVSLLEDTISIGLLFAAAILSKKQGIKTLLFIAAGAQLIITICYQLFVY